MLYIDNQSHSHFPPSSSSSSSSSNAQIEQSQQDSSSNLIPIEELNNLTYINTARTRNDIPSKILRPLIQNTKDDIHIVE